MKPSPTEYHPSASLDEALALLAEHGEEAKVLAGGQSLVPLMNLRLAAPAHLVDIMRAPELSSIVARDDAIEVGAAVRQAEAGEHAALMAACPLLAAALPHIAHREIRNAGTVCGSLAHADPAAELPAVALALDAELIVRGPRGERTLPASEFFRSFLETALEPDELLTAVRLPLAGEGTGAAVHELARRAGDFAIAGAGAVLTVQAGRVVAARVACFGVDSVPVRARLAEQALVGQPAVAATFAAAAQAAAGQLDPPADLHASAAFRRHAAESLMRRALVDAAARAQRHEPNGRGAG